MQDFVLAVWGRLVQGAAIALRIHIIKMGEFHIAQQAYWLVDFIKYMLLSYSVTDKSLSLVIYSYHIT